MRNSRYRLDPPLHGDHPDAPSEVRVVVGREEQAGRPLPPLVELISASPPLQIIELEARPELPKAGKRLSPYARLVREVRQLRSEVAELREQIKTVTLREASAGNAMKA